MTIVGSMTVWRRARSAMKPVISGAVEVDVLEQARRPLHPLRVLALSITSWASTP
jgi:hypothetical protein